MRLIFEFGSIELFDDRQGVLAYFLYWNDFALVIEKACNIGLYKNAIFNNEYDPSAPEAISYWYLIKCEIWCFGLDINFVSSVDREKIRIQKWRDRVKVNLIRLFSR